MTFTEASARPEQDAQTHLIARWLYRCVAVGIGLLIGLILAEIGLWVIAPLTSNEVLLWQPDGHLRGVARPNQTLRTGTGYEISINSIGFRGRDYTWHPPPGTLRIAAFGGSSTFGLEAASVAITWTHQLQEELAESLEMPVEVINLGLPGYDCSNSKLNYLSTGRALHPHIIIVYHGWNDFKQFRPLATGPQLHTKVIRQPSLAYRFARHFQLARRAARIRNNFREAEFENQTAAIEGNAIDVDRPIADAAIAWFEQNFHDFVRFAHGDGVLPVLITQATLVHEQNLDQPEYRRAIREHWVGMSLPRLHETWKQCNAAIREISNTEDAIFIDGYSAVPHDFEHLTDHVHLADPGRTRLALAIARALLNDDRFQEVTSAVLAQSPSR